MAVDVFVEFRDKQTTKQLFTYPNTGHEDQTLEETIEHYFSDSMRREELSAALIDVEVSDEQCRVKLTLPDVATADAVAARYQSFFDIGKIGLQEAGAFENGGHWDSKWKFLLPLGVPVAFAKAIEVMDFPPLTLISSQDYLKSKTTSRWWELLMLNGVSDAEKALYSCILDIVPVAAPASDGQKLNNSGIYNGPFDGYGLPFLEALTKTQSAARRPLMALGMPIRTWIERLWNLSLNVGETGTITLASGSRCSVLASNHPSFFYYAVSSNTGPDATEKNIAAGLAVMKQDIVCAAWHSEMGRNPASDPRQVLTNSEAEWKDRDAELLALVKKQAGIAHLLTETTFSMTDIVKARRVEMKPVDLRELERRFYKEGSDYII